MHTSIQILVQNWNKISTLTSVRLLYRAWVTPSSKTHTLTSTYQISIWYCMNRLSFCNIYVIQRDTQYLMILFITFNSSTCFGLQYSIFRSVLMLYVAIWYVSIRPVVMRVKEELLCSSSFTLITYRDIPNFNIQHKNAPEMEYWSPKHVELLNVMNKINHQLLCILLDYRYIKYQFL